MAALMKDKLDQERELSAEGSLTALLAPSYEVVSYDEDEEEEEATEAEGDDFEEETEFEEEDEFEEEEDEDDYGENVDQEIADGCDEDDEVVEGEAEERRKTVISHEEEHSEIVEVKSSVEKSVQELYGTEELKDSSSSS